MHFNAAAAVLLGLVGFVSGAPRPESGLSHRSPGKHLHSHHVQSLESRNVVVVAGGDNNRNNDPNRNNGNNENNRNNDRNGSNRNNGNNRNDVNNIIVSTTVIQLSDSQRQQEVALILIVQEQVRRRSGCNYELRRQRDNIRRNHYRNKNRDVNTVIVVVTEVVDNRSSNRQSRYMSRRLHANNGRSSDVTVIVADAAITLLPDSNQRNQNQRENGVNQPGGAQPTRVLDLGNAAASAAALAAIQTVDPSAPFLQTNRTVLAPAGQAFPSYAGVELDPARIADEGAQGVFVSVVV